MDQTHFYNCLQAASEGAEIGFSVTEDPLEDALFFLDDAERIFFDGIRCPWCLEDLLEIQWQKDTDELKSSVRLEFRDNDRIVITKKQDTCRCYAFLEGEMVSARRLPKEISRRAVEKYGPSNLTVEMIASRLKSCLKRLHMQKAFSVLGKENDGTQADLWFRNNQFYLWGSPTPYYAEHFDTIRCVRSNKNQAVVRIGLSNGDLLDLTPEGDADAFVFEHWVFSWQKVLQLYQAYIEAKNEGVLNSDFVIGNGKLLSYQGKERTVIIPDGTKTIFDGCFLNKPVESVEMPDSVVSINERAFAGCRHLKRIKVSEKLAEIESYAFAGCTLLCIKEFLTHNQLKKVDKEVFEECKVEGVEELSQYMEQSCTS